MMLKIMPNQEYHGCGWNNYSAMTSVKLDYTFWVHKFKKNRPLSDLKENR